MDDNLISIKKLKSDMESMKLLSIFLNPEQRRMLKDMESKVKNIIAQTTDFNNRFSSYGWCAYDSMSLALIESANAAFEAQGIEAAEQILINYYLIPQNSKRRSKSQESMNPAITSSKSKAELTSVNSEMTGNENQIINYCTNSAAFDSAVTNRHIILLH